jgi:hypothetical protein
MQAQHKPTISMFSICANRIEVSSIRVIVLLHWNGNISFFPLYVHIHREVDNGSICAKGGHKNGKSP